MDLVLLCILKDKDVLFEVKQTDHLGHESSRFFLTDR